MINIFIGWARYYRKESFMVNINTSNGAERQNETFKHTYLKKHDGSSLTGTLSILIEDYFLNNMECNSAI